MIIPTGVAAQNGPAQSKKGQYHHYQFIDLGTFGGPTSVNPGPLFAAGTKCHEMPILRV
jgi:hypothetical protein